MEYRLLEGTRKNSVNYECNNFLYRKNSASENVIYVRCTKSDCFGRGIIQGDRLTVKWGHSHPPEEDLDISAQIAKSQMKRRAENTATDLREIYDEECDNNVTAGTFSYHEIQSTLRKRRRSNFPNLPRTSTEASQTMDAGAGGDDSYNLNFL